MAREHLPADAARRAAELLRDLLGAASVAVYGAVRGRRHLRLLSSSPSDDSLPPAFDLTVVNEARPSAGAYVLLSGDWILSRPTRQVGDHDLLFAVRRYSEVWTLDDRAFADDLADVLAAGLRWCLDAAAMARHVVLYHRLLGNSYLLGGPDALEEQFDTICRAALELVGGGWASLCFFSEDGVDLTQSFGPIAFDAPDPPPEPSPYCEALGHQAALAREAIFTPAGSDLAPNGAAAAAGLTAATAIPLIVGDRAVGALALFTDCVEPPSETILGSLQLIAAHAAVGFHAAQLVDRLQSSEARYRGLFDNVAAAVIVTDRLGWIRLMNRRAVEVSGYSRQEAEGKLRLAILAAPEEWGRLTRTIATMPTGLGNFGDTNEYDCVTADGRRRRIRAQILPSPGSNELLITFLDITVERDLHRQLLQAEKIASLGQLVSGVAHELNNPLAAILGSAELSLRDNPSPATAEHLHRVLDQTERCRGIIANLLTFARERQAERLPVDINAVVLRALDLQSYALSVDNIQVDLNLARDLPFILGDPPRLQQVVLNLILNAHQAMRGRGQGHLTFTTAAQHGRVLLTVADTGPGISADNLPRIFDPFFSTKPVGEGTGLGLAVSLGIILDLGGNMWAESSPGCGARFCVELPEAIFAAIDAQPQMIVGQDEEPAPAPESDIAPASTPNPAPGVRVLIVEDELAVRDVIECALEAEGFLVQTAPDGQDAATMLGSTDFDAVLCDLRTPRMDGIRLYRHVAERNPAQAARFIIVTGDAASDYTRRFLERVGLPVLRKPFSLTALRRIVLEVTSRPH
jgi:PAS domain S-box-containing protein